MWQCFYRPPVNHPTTWDGGLGKKRSKLVMRGDGELSNGRIIALQPNDEIGARLPPVKLIAFFPRRPSHPGAHRRRDAFRLGKVLRGQTALDLGRLHAKPRSSTGIVVIGLGVSTIRKRSGGAPPDQKREVTMTRSVPRVSIIALGLAAFVSSSPL
jgi:hypothetical protein